MVTFHRKGSAGRGPVRGSQVLPGRGTQRLQDQNPYAPGLARPQMRLLSQSVLRPVAAPASPPAIHMQACNPLWRQ